MQQRQRSLQEIIVELNQAHKQSIQANTKAGKESAEKTFYDCHDWLRLHGVRIRMRGDGEWILFQ